MSSLSVKLSCMWLFGFGQPEKKKKADSIYSLQKYKNLRWPQFNLFLPQSHCWGIDILQYIFENKTMGWSSRPVLQYFFFFTMMSRFQNSAKSQNIYKNTHMHTYKLTHTNTLTHTFTNTHIQYGGCF